ncbi:MAG: GntR family transcriptional regulator [Bacteroidota bacterium]|nr:GntR family transcriptional regulator [Bacteroidota bacterium]MDP4211410.1 GntR family transcriptional regulator [Bacteroidota bacterium]MDP4248637.1 GntR family transcriptional regulator [Bacteroidota bacterium]
MNNIYEINSERKTPKYLQIIDSINNSIKNGKLKKGDRLLSINELSNEFLLSRDTVQKAYDLLEKKGVILPVRGKGFYINRTDINTSYRILLLFNKISNYKKQIYNAFVQAMGTHAVIDLKIHYSNTRIFSNLLENHMHEYDYYVIMPHFYEHEEEAYALIRKIPTEKLLILDKDVRNLNSNYAAVYQDFKNDIGDALQTGLPLLKKYDKLILVYPKLISYPNEIVVGFRNFCMAFNQKYSIIQEINPDTAVHPKEAFIVIEETDLVNLIKICRSQKWMVGKDVGIISYNETPLKEILQEGITVLSTDHTKMGEDAARLILENKKEKIKNPFSLLIRKSL